MTCHDDPLATSRTITKPLGLDAPTTRGDRAIVEDKIDEVRGVSDRRYEAVSTESARQATVLAKLHTVAWVALAVSGVSVLLRVLKLLME